MSKSVEIEDGFYLIIKNDESLMKLTKKELIEYIRQLEKLLCGEDNE